MFFILSALLISLTYARNCTKPTEKCPLGETSWNNRAQQFKCLNKNGKYTCLKDNDNNIVETCVGRVEIRKGVVGCPYIVLCQKNEAVIGLDEDFHHCPTNKTGCPPKNHTGYLLHEIYKYPACSTLVSSNANEEDITELQDKESASKSPWIPIIIALIGIVTVLFVVFGIIFYSRKKNVKIPCCGRTEESVNVELGMGKSLLRDEEARGDGVKDEELRDETLQSDIRQFGDEMKETIERQDSARIMENLDKWKKESVHIGIAGLSMVGKSSFINALLGTNLTSKKAEIGLGDTTLIPTVYHHPKIKGLEFWDMPGYGTKKFKLDEKYIQDMKIQHYDFLLIFYSSKISETDIKFVRHLLRMDKTFAVVRTADKCTGPRMKDKPFDDWVRITKKKCRSTLKKGGITEEVPIFVISNVSPRLGDFDNLLNFLSENTPEMKRMNIFLTFKRQTSEMIDKKESQLLDRAWKTAIAMGISTALPIPAIDIAFNMILLKEEIMFYLKAFQLDEESLKEHPKLNVKQLKTCHEILNLGLMKFIVDSIGKFALLSTVGNIFEFALPVLGGIINGTASTYCMYNFLKKVITSLAEDARTLKKLQTDSFI